MYICAVPSQPSNRKFRISPIVMYSYLNNIAVTSQPSNCKFRIPPIVIYSYLNNHSATLKKVNEKLSTPVDVTSKSHNLLLYTK